MHEYEIIINFPQVCIWMPLTNFWNTYFLLWPLYSKQKCLHIVQWLFHEYIFNEPTQAFLGCCWGMCHILMNLLLDNWGWINELRMNWWRLFLHVFILCGLSVPELYRDFFFPLVDNRIRLWKSCTYVTVKIGVHIYPFMNCVERFFPQNIHTFTFSHSHAQVITTSDCDGYIQSWWLHLATDNICQALFEQVTKVCLVCKYDSQSIILPCK